MAGKRGDKGLTPKQEAFCRAYIENGGNASAAYRSAYDASGMVENTINIEAHRLLNHPKIAPRLEESRAKIAEKLDITVETLTRMLIEDRELARTNNDAGNAVKAVDALGRLHGLVIEKKHVVSDNRHHHKSEELSESAAWAAALLGGETDCEAQESLPN